MLNLEFKKNCFCSANGFNDLKNKKYFLVKHFEGSKGGCGLWHHVWKTSKEEASKDIEDRRGELYIAFFDVENKDKIKARIKENKAIHKKAAKMVEDFCGGKTRTKNYGVDVGEDKDTITECAYIPMCVNSMLHCSREKDTANDLIGKSLKDITTPPDADRGV